MADPKPSGKRPPELRPHQVTEDALIDALDNGTGPAQPDPKQYGDFDQPGFDAKPLVGKYLTPQEYKESGLEASAIKNVAEMRADKELGGLVAALQANKKLDIDGDGKVDDREIAAVVTAASYDKKGKFDNGISQADIDKLRDSGRLEEVVRLAKNLVGSGSVQSEGTDGPATTGRAASAPEQSKER